jgi:hypothetical protein
MNTAPNYTLIIFIIKDIYKEEQGGSWDQDFCKKESSEASKRFAALSTGSH